jgi:hypothetical protein
LTAHGRGKETSITSICCIFFAVEERKTDRALLPFEVASIPFDISLSVFSFFSFHVAAASTAVSLFNLSSGIIGAEVTNDSKGKTKLSSPRAHREIQMRDIF